MRIVIDMQGAQTESRFRGIGRYTMAFAQAVVRNRGEHEVILALSGLFPDTIEPIRAAFDGVLPQENIRVWHGPGPVRDENPANGGRREVAELIREAFLASLRPDIVHITSLFEGYVDDAVTSVGRFDRQTLVSVILYDLIPLLNPDHYLKPNPSFAAYYERKLQSLNHAALYLAISAYTRQEGLDCLGVDSERIVNISTAIGTEFQVVQIEEEAARTLCRKLGLSRAFVLYTGGADERKNLPRLIEAWSTLPAPLRQEHQLLFAGRMPEGNVAEFRHIARRQGLKDDELVFSGYVSDEELIQLYNLCKLYVFPSWHEGFGLPALEAMACGAPVIGANTTSLPEVVGLDEALFDPFDVSSISATMASALADEAFRTRLRNHGLLQAQRFSWDETALRAIEAFEKLHHDQDPALGQGYAGDEIVKRLLNAIAFSRRSNHPSDDECKLLADAIAANHPAPGRQKRLFIDVSELVQRDVRTGIQRVTRAILRELLVAPPSGYRVEAVYSPPGSKNYRSARRFQGDFLGGDTLSEPDEVLDPHAGDVFLGLDLQPQIVPQCREYYRHLRKTGVAVYFVVYDLLPIRLPAAFPSGADQSHALWLETVVESDGAICISKAVADDLLDWVEREAPQKNRSFCVKWFHLGADIANSAPSQGIPADGRKTLTQLKQRPTFLMVGTVEPRKGYGQALTAFDLLWQNGADVGLAIIGRAGWGTDAEMAALAAHSELGKRLFWIKDASDEYLEALYAGATCLLAASEGEGFGLPLIEAAQRGLPIIARDIPVFREVAGSCALYFAGSQPGDLAAAVEEWLRLHSAGTAPSSAGLVWKTWSESADQLLRQMFALNHGVDSGCVAEAVQRERRRGEPPAGSDSSGASVLMLATCPIRRPRHGGQLRTASIRRAFVEAGFFVRSIAFYQSEAYSDADLDEWDIPFPPDSKERLFEGQNLGALSDFLMGEFSVGNAAAFSRVLDAIDFDVDLIVVEQTWLYPLAERLVREEPRCRGATVVYSSHNIEAPMKRKILEGQASEGVVTRAVERIEALERAAAKGADLVVAVTPEEASVLRSFGAAEIVLAPNGIEPWRADPECVESWRSRLPEQPWPIFIASAHPPNFTGFLAAMGDSLACIPPGSRLVVAGGVGEHIARELSKSPWANINSGRLQILGVLDDADLAAVKTLAHAFLLPIKEGGGSNIKTAEALYSGKPIVCTGVALRGFENYRNLPDVQVADNPKAFQAAVRMVLAAPPGASAGQSPDSALRQELTWDACLKGIPREALRVMQEKRRTNR